MEVNDLRDNFYYIGAGRLWGRYCNMYGIGRDNSQMCFLRGKLRFCFLRDMPAALGRSLYLILSFAVCRCEEARHLFFFCCNELRRGEELRGDMVDADLSQSPYIDCRRGQAPDLTTFYFW